MLLRDVKNNRVLSLSELIKYSKTLNFRRKLDNAFRAVEDFLSVAKNPIVSCGGGKDGTAAALIARRIDPKIKIVCADPVNPLPDREEHVSNLQKWLGGEWHRVPYSFDVDAVLSGKLKYPESLKIDTLNSFAQQNNIDGVIFGIRAAESRARQINFYKNGKIYKVKSGIRCQPIADMTAEESLCTALLFDAPINPVYAKPDGIDNLEYLHDGTWWAHGMKEQAGWIRRFYPDYYDLYLASAAVESDFKPCEF